MNDLAKVLTDESKIVLQNGTVIEGAEKVSILMLNVCEVYRQAYNKAYIATLGKYAVGTAVVGLVVVGGYYVVRKKYQKYLEE